MPAASAIGTASIGNSQFRPIFGMSPVPSITARPVRK
jgi:hypothetical protein